MNKQLKKVIAPVIITVLLIICFIGYLTIWASAPLSLLVRIIGIIVFVILIGVSLFVLFERIKEIRSGEEDDLGKY